MNWKSGEDVIIVPAISDDEAKQKFPGGWKAPKPSLRIMPQSKYAAACSEGRPSGRHSPSRV